MEKAESPRQGRTQTIATTGVAGPERGRRKSPSRPSHLESGASPGRRSPHEAADGERARRTPGRYPSDSLPGTVVARSREVVTKPSGERRNGFVGRTLRAQAVREATDRSSGPASPRTVRRSEYSIRRTVSRGA